MALGFVGFGFQGLGRSDGSGKSFIIQHSIHNSFDWRLCGVGAVFLGKQEFLKSLFKGMSHGF